MRPLIRLAAVAFILAGLMASAAGIELKAVACGGPLVADPAKVASADFVAISMYTADLSKQAKRLADSCVTHGVVCDICLVPTPPGPYPGVKVIGES